MAGYHISQVHNASPVHRGMRTPAPARKARDTRLEHDSNLENCLVSCSNNIAEKDDDQQVLEPFVLETPVTLRHGPCESAYCGTNNYP